MTFEDNWYIRDLSSGNGLYVDGRRVQRFALTHETRVRLGSDGPLVSFALVAQPCDELNIDPSRPDEQGNSEQSIKPRPRAAATSDSIVRRYIEHYFNKSEVGPLGEHTMYVRRAFAKAQSRQKRTYTWIIVLLVVGVLCVGSYALYERIELEKQRTIAKDLFYNMKSLDVEIARLEIDVAHSSKPQELQSAQQYATQREQLQSSYDRYLATLHIYDPKLTEQQRIILRVARIFGECELDMPLDFEAEVNKYIAYWKRSDRLATAVRTAREEGYDETIARELLAKGLPPQFFYLA